MNKSNQIILATIVDEEGLPAVLDELSVIVGEKARKYAETSVTLSMRLGRCLQNLQNAKERLRG